MTDTFATLDLSPMDEITGALDIILAVLSLTLDNLEGRSPANIALYAVEDLLKSARNKHAEYHIVLMHAAASTEAAA